MTKQNYQLTDWLPTTKKEIEIRGWDDVDVVFFSGDAYVDHPSFGAAVIGRVIESEGLRVAIVPQPNWRDDLRDFKKMGKPRLCFAISAGCMDSMVNHYTANKRLRHNDAYSPNGQFGLRPDRATVVYSKILKELYPEVPIVLGGIEASLRRFAQYDYWDNKFHKDILTESGADLLVYGMGEKPIRDIMRVLKSEQSIEACYSIPQVGYLSKTMPKDEHCVVLKSAAACAKNPKVSAATLKIIEEESNKLNQTILVQPTGNRFMVVNPANKPMSTQDLDAVFDLPFTRLPHPKYKNKHIPAFEMIRFSVNLHRGCFGGCSFCTISMHQGKFIVSRSKESILKEVRQISEMPDFKGYLSDLGGPSANMYKMAGRNQKACEKCKRPSCIFPAVCPNLNTDHRPMLDVFKAVDALPYIKKSFISSGVRYDLLLHKDKDPAINKSHTDYTRELIVNHVSGRLKVAPEHTSDYVLNAMRKPSFKLFKQFVREFETINQQEGLKQQIIPYFISSHPACTQEDMAELAYETKRLHFQLEQIQDFTPTPMTVSTEMFHTQLDPYTLKPVYVAKSPKEKLDQRQFFFWYKRDAQRGIQQSLLRMNRRDLIDKLLR